MRKRVLLLVLGCALLLSGCGGPGEPETGSTQEVAMSFSISSPAFEAGKPIPAVCTCRGRNISPALNWDEPPAGTQAFALIMDDPDAPMGTWVHWVLYNLPAVTRSLPEAVPGDAQLADGSMQGRNSSRGTGYQGPCPPSGTHRYYFKLYALDAPVNLGSGAGKEDLLKAMEGHILGQAELMGTFSR